MEQRTLWNPKVELMSEGEMKSLQLKRLKKQVAYNYRRSEFYKDKFDSAGIKPADIQSFEDFQQVPLMTKAEHRRAQKDSLERFGHPYGLIACAPREKIVRINSTSGTTGIPTLYTLTKHDVNVVNEMHARKYWRAGIRRGDVMIQALSLSMFTGGLPLSEGIQHMGACVVPVGVEGGTRRVLDFIHLTSPVAIIATPSFGEYLIEQAPKLTGRPASELGLRWFFCAAEPGGGDPEMNFSLRLTIDKAKEANMPKDNIERAISKGIGQGEEGSLEQVSYEAVGKDGVALIIDCVTDNTNRTVTEVRNVLTEYGYNLSPGGAGWQFETKGKIVLAPVRIVAANKFRDGSDQKIEKIDKDELILEIMEMEGVEDVGEKRAVAALETTKSAQVVIEVVLAKTFLSSVGKMLDEKKYKVISMGVVKVPKNSVEVSDPQLYERFEAMIEALKGLDDTESVWNNVKIE